MKPLEALKNVLKGLAAMGLFFAFSMCAIGATGALIANNYYLFAVVTVACLVFAAKPMYQLFKDLAK